MLKIAILLSLLASLPAAAQIPVPANLNMTTTASASNTGTSVAVAATASDAASGINSVVISLDGVAAQTCPFTAAKTPAACSATVTWKIGTGAHTVLATAVNALGLVLTSSVVFQG